jgi:hypothetical protein
MTNFLASNASAVMVFLGRTQVLSSWQLARQSGRLVDQDRQVLGADVKRLVAVNDPDQGDFSAGPFAVQAVRLVFWHSFPFVFLDVWLCSTA